MSNPIRAQDVEPEDISWLWNERIPRGMISVIAGRPDQGKGLFAAYLAAHVTNDATIRPGGGKVLYSAIEDSHGLMTRPRLEAAGANLHNVLLWRFQLPIMFSELTTHVTEKNIDLIVMDPFAAHLSGGVSRGSDTIRQLLNPLTELIEGTGTAVVVVEHVLKRVPASSHPLNAIGGSGSGLPAASRSAYILGQDPNDDEARYLCCVKNNLREKPSAIRFEVDTRVVENVDRDVPCLVYDDEVEYDVRRLFEGKEKGSIGRPPDKRAAAAEWLTNYLYDAKVPVKAGTVIEDAIQIGMTRKTLRRAAEEIGVVKNPPGGGRNVTWELSQDTIDAIDGVDPNALVAAEAEEEDGLSLTDEDLTNLLAGDPVAADEVPLEEDGADGAA